MNMRFVLKDIIPGTSKQQLSSDSRVDVGPTTISTSKLTQQCGSAPTTPNKLASKPTTRNQTMSPLIISAVQVGDMDGFIEEISNVCAVDANQTVPKPKSKRTIYDRLKPNQKKKLDILFEADPTLKEFYNQTKIAYPEPRNFDKLNESKLNARIKELKEEKHFKHEN